MNGSYLGQITSGKQVGAKIGSAQIGTYNFQNHEITGKKSVCSKQTRFKEK